MVDHDTLSRRSFVRLAGATAALSFAGSATASDGSAQYVVLGNRNAVDRIESEGFDVVHDLAGGDVLVVHGEADAAEDLEGIGGVSAATRDGQFELERPARSELAAEEELDPPTLYEQFQWDKQVTDTLDANEVTTGEGASVAVIDSGCDYRHPDLTPNLQRDEGLLFREGEVRSGTADDVVVARPAPDSDLEFTVDRVRQHVADDVDGHGTHVAGVAAAAADEGALGSGVTGTAPDADLIAYRVFWWVEDPEADEDAPVDERWVSTTTTGDVLASIDRAAAEGYDVANLSLGTPPLPPQVNGDPLVRAYKKVVRSAVQRGTVVVASAGNDAADLQQGGRLALPNSVTGALSVSATGPNDELAFYSNFGTNEIDVGAPGGGYETREKTLETDEEAVEWPYPTNLVFSTTSPRVEGAPYGWKAGTSFAAPQVAGLAALVRALAPDEKPNQVGNEIEHGAEETDGRGDPELGAGRIDARATVDRVGGGGNGGNGNGNNGNGNGN